MRQFWHFGITTTIQKASLGLTRGITLDGVVKSTLLVITAQTRSSIITSKAYYHATLLTSAGENLTDENIELKQERHLVSYGADHMFASGEGKTFCSLRISTCGLLHARNSLLNVVRS